MNVITYLAIGVAALGILLCAGCASRGRALRPTLGQTNDPSPDIRKADAWYIESKPVDGGKPISCSFVEFDERGDYLDFQQHRHAYLKIKELADTQKERLLVVIYVHGWKNNSQSGDVVEFNSFLRQMASSPMAREGGFRVHGVYLAWRGNAMRHALDRKSRLFNATQEVFGGELIVNPRYSRKPAFGWLLWLPEQLSYWSRKNAAEDKVSGVALNRTIFTCGHTARRYGATNAPNVTFLMGHSMGALMLEQSFAPASLARLTDEWPWDDENLIEKAKANPLPFDLVLLVNSAAPSIYAKQFHGYMVAHRAALARHGIVGADAPLVISLTTEADTATGKVHPIGNALAPLFPSLWRKYRGDDFILAPGDGVSEVRIPQHYYYRRTPGHNPLLVNHWIVPAKETRAPDQTKPIFEQNMKRPDAKDPASNTFHTSPRKTGGKPLLWEITTTTPDPDWSSYHGHKPVILGTKAANAGYWIMRCEKEIMSGHNDIWSQQAMEMYAALFRHAQQLREQPPAMRR